MSVREKPSASHNLNCRRLIQTILGVQIGVLICAAPLYWAAGLTFDWSSVLGQLEIAAVFGLGAALSQRDRNGVPQALWAVTFLLTAWLIFGPLQYLAAAWNRPLIDGWLLRADEWFRIPRPAIDRWLTIHPVARRVIGIAYTSFLPQFLIVPLVLGWVDRHRLWRFVLQFQLTALTTVVLFGLWPAGTPGLHGVHEWSSQQSAMDQLFSIRAGTMRVLDLTQADGLISWPSFHTAGALLVVWTLRGTWLFWPAVLVDGVLVAATVLLGLHYTVDVLGGIGAVALIVWVTERHLAKGANPLDDAHPCTEG
jgi:hypothetical protein